MTTLRDIAFLILLATFAGTSHSRAAVFWAEHFNYADGQLTDSELNMNPGQNVSGGLWVGHSGTTFSDNVDVISGKAQILNSGSEDVNRSVGVAMGAGDTWYYAVSFTVNFTGNVGGCGQ